MLRKLVAWMAVLAWMYLIFWLSGKPRVVPVMNPLLSYAVSTLGHLVFYAILYLLVYRALRISSALTNRQIVFWSLLLVLLYGISDEFHQSFVPGRDASLVDVIFDLLGGVIVARLQAT